MKVYTIYLLLLVFLSACGGGGGSSTSSNNTTNVSPTNGATTSTTKPTTYTRTKSVPAYTAKSDVTVASSYLHFKSDTPIDVSLTPYLSGSLDGKYVTDVLDGASISFDVAVPDDNVTYGGYANKTVKYIGILFYPTKKDANYSNAQTLGAWELPSQYTQMENNTTTTPVFQDATKKYPLLVYSHGIGGEALASGKETYRFASHGYVVVSLFHGDRRFDKYGPTTTPEELSLRALSLKTVTDFLQTSKYASHINFDKIGAFGNSYGGASSFILLGAKPINTQSPLGYILSNIVDDPRVKVGVGIEPAMGDASLPVFAGTQVTLFGYGASGATDVSKPYLAITGTDDTIAVESLTQYTLSKTSANSHLVSMEGETHGMTPEGLATSETWALYFLNYYLKGDTTFLSMKDVAGMPIDTYSSPY